MVRRILCYIVLATVTMHPILSFGAPAASQSEAKTPDGKEKNATPPGWTSKEEAELEEHAPTPAPDIPFTDENGQPHSFEEFYGKVVLVNLWATWCAPCAQEMPSLVKLQKDFKRKNFKVLALSEDFKGAEAVKEFYATNGITNLDIYVDPKNTLFKAFGVVGLPTSIVINAEGSVVARILGYVDWENEQIRQYLLSLTDQKTYAPEKKPAKAMKAEATPAVPAVPAEEEKSMPGGMPGGMMVPILHPKKDQKALHTDKIIAKAEKLLDKKSEGRQEEKAERDIVPEKAVTVLPEQDNGVESQSLADPKLRRAVNQGQ